MADYYCKCKDCEYIDPTEKKDINGIVHIIRVMRIPMKLKNVDIIKNVVAEVRDVF